MNTLQSTVLLLIAVSLLPACHKSRNRRQPQATLTTIQFGTRAEVDVGAFGPSDVIARDFTGDGKPDLLVAALAGGSVQFLVGDGQGAFSLAAGQSIPVPGAPFSVAAGDFTGDGSLDFAVLRLIDRRVSVYLNDGAGRFAISALPDLVTGDLSEGVYASDVTNDGIVDLIVTNFSDESIQIFQGNGAAGFLPRAPMQLGAGNSPSGCACVDVNDDGHLDLVVGIGSKDSVVVYPGQAGGTFGPLVAFPVGNGPTSVAVADVTGDGIIDILSADLTDHTVSLLAGIGGGQFQPRVVLSVDGPPSSIAVADLNADGIQDIVVSVFDRAAISFLAGKGGGEFEPEVQYGTTGLPLRVRIADVNGDGFPDVMATGATSDRLSLFFGAGAQGIIGAVNYETGRKSPAFTSCADFDLDGFADVAVADSRDGVVSIMRGAASGTISGFHLVQVGSGAGNMTRADFDVDGRQDLAVAVAGGLRILANRSTPGNLVFEVFPSISEPPFPAGIGPFEIASARIDNDSLPDLVVADYGGDAVRFLAGQPGGLTFTEMRPPLPVSGGPLGLVVGNLVRGGPQDGLDIAVARFREATVSIFRGDGLGGFVVAQDIPVGAEPNYLRAADFNQDSFLDLVVSNLGSDSITLISGLPAGGFDASTMPAGEGPTALLATDLNRDGHADILVTNYVGADLRIFLGDGLGGFPTVFRFPGTYNAVSADLGDVNGDGLPDLSIASLLTTRVSLLLNRSR